MSFSFTVRGASIAAAVAAAAEKMDEVVAQQPNHSVDRDAVVATAGAYAALLQEPAEDGEEVQLNIHGSLGWNGTGDKTTYHNAVIGLTANIVRAPLDA